MGVQGSVQRIVVVLGDVKHAGTEVLGSVGSLEREQLKDSSNNWILDSFKALHHGPSGGDVHLESEPLGTLSKGDLLSLYELTEKEQYRRGLYQATLDRHVVTTKECLLRKINANMLRNGNISSQHELNTHKTQSANRMKAEPPKQRTSSMSL